MRFYLMISCPAEVIGGSPGGLCGLGRPTVPARKGSLGLRRGSNARFLLCRVYDRVFVVGRELTAGRATASVGLGGRVYAEASSGLEARGFLLSGSYVP